MIEERSAALGGRTDRKFASGKGVKADVYHRQ